jgi:hypothetical protein
VKRIRITSKGSGLQTEVRCGECDQVIPCFSAMWSVTAGELASATIVVDGVTLDALVPRGQFCIHVRREIGEASKCDS